MSENIQKLYLTIFTCKQPKKKVIFVLFHQEVTLRSNVYGGLKLP